MAAARVGACSAVASDTTNNTTLVITTNAVIASGNTAFYCVESRAGTPTGITSVSGFPGDAVTEILTVNRGLAVTASIIRAYYPSGQGTAQALTFTFDQATTRKIGIGDVWSGIANANNVATATANGASGACTSGTTAATSITDGVHVCSFSHPGATSGVTGTPGADEEGTMTEILDAIVGASTFQQGYAQVRAVTAVHAAGMTGGFTPTDTTTQWVGIQGVWAGVTASVGAPPRKRYRPSARALLNR